MSDPDAAAAWAETFATVCVCEVCDSVFWSTDVPRGHSLTICPDCPEE